MLEQLHSLPGFHRNQVGTALTARQGGLLEDGDGALIRGKVAYEKPGNFR